MGRLKREKKCCNKAVNFIAVSELDEIFFVSYSQFLSHLSTSFTPLSPPLFPHELVI